MNGHSIYENNAYCGHCGEFRPRVPRCPECGLMMRFWPKECRNKEWRMKHK